MRNPLLLLLTLLVVLPASAQLERDANTGRLYEIALNGEAVTIDGDLSDWDDAMFVFMSAQSPLNQQLTDAGAVAFDPADFSGYMALKMDAENLYVAAIVRDEGGTFNDTPVGASNLIWQFDHLAVYLGLYDIDLDGTQSPHFQGSPDYDGFSFTHPTIADSTIAAGRSYRISPGSDDSGTTLGPDYQIGARLLDYDGVTTGDDVVTYNWGIVDTTIQNTTIATELFDDENGYYVEWKVPFASLAGQISRPSGLFADFEWPAFTPMDGMVIPVDMDLSDNDGTTDADVRFLGAGGLSNKWRDVANFGLVAKIVDLSVQGNYAPSTRAFIDYEEDQNVTIDGDMSDWNDAGWIGMSQDKLGYSESDVITAVGVEPDDPSDFAGYVAVKMDDQNVYFGAIVFDGDTPLIDTPADSNLAFQHDHLSIYMGMYDIEDMPNSPHAEGGGEFFFLHPTIADSTSEADRTYRIGPGTDNTTTTLGSDFQLLFRATDYGTGDGVVTGEAAERFNYAGGVVNNALEGATAATAFFDDETGYYMEWSVPLSSFEGMISDPARNLADFAWPGYNPTIGDVLPFDGDVTDKDEGDQIGTRFLRIGDKLPLWRDAFEWSRRALVTGGTFVTTSIEEVASFPEVEGMGLLRASYPNPTRGEVAIPFEMPAAGSARLAVYNLLGQEVALLVDGALGQGGKVFRMDTSSLPAGSYLIRLTTDRGSESRLMTVLR